mgnify:CR=1 FL=1
MKHEYDPKSDPNNSLSAFNDNGISRISDNGAEFNPALRHSDTSTSTGSLDSLDAEMLGAKYDKDGSIADMRIRVDELYAEEEDINSRKSAEYRANSAIKDAEIKRRRKQTGSY